MDSFLEIYERYYRDVYRFALFLSGDRATAEDLAGDTFVRAFAVGKPVRLDTVKSYLLTIVRNLHRDQQRKSGRFTPLDTDVRDPSPSIDIRLQSAAQLSDIRSRLRTIAKGDRHALLLYVVREMTYADIAKTLGISVGAAKSRVFRAREALLNTRLIANRGTP